MTLNFVPCVKKVACLFHKKISQGAAELTSKLLNDLNATLVMRCQEKAGSSVMDKSTALHAVTAVFRGEVQRHALIEGGVTLVNFNSGLLHYNYKPVEESEGPRKLKIPALSESSSSNKTTKSIATMSAVDISCGLQNVVGLTYPRAQMDNEITQNMSEVLKNMIEHIAKTTQEQSQQKKCITPLEVQNSLAKCFLAQMLKHAQSEGAKCTFLFKLGLLPIRGVSKSTKSVKTPASSIKKTERKAKITKTASKKTASGKTKNILKSEKKTDAKRSLKTAEPPSKRAKISDEQLKEGILEQFKKDKTPTVQQGSTETIKPKKKSETKKGELSKKKASAKQKKQSSKKKLSKKIISEKSEKVRTKRKATATDLRQVKFKRQKKAGLKSKTSKTRKKTPKKSTAISKTLSEKKASATTPNILKADTSKSKPSTTSKRKRKASAAAQKESAKRQKKSTLKSETFPKKTIPAIKSNIPETKTSEPKQSKSSKRKSEFSSSSQKEAKKAKISRKKTKSAKGTQKKTTARSKESSKNKQVSKEDKASPTVMIIEEEAIEGPIPPQKKKEDTEGQIKSRPDTKDTLTLAFTTGLWNISKKCFSHTLTPEAAKEIVLKLQSLFDQVMAQLGQQKSSTIGPLEVQQAVLKVFPADLADLALAHMSQTLFIHSNT